MQKKQYSPVLKFKVALAALTGVPIADICKQYEITDGLVHKWKQLLKERGADVFSQKKALRDVSREAETAKLYQQIGRLSTELDFLKKVVGD